MALSATHVLTCVVLGEGAQLSSDSQRGRTSKHHCLGLGDTMEALPPSSGV